MEQVAVGQETAQDPSSLTPVIITGNPGVLRADAAFIACIASPTGSEDPQVHIQGEGFQRILRRLTVTCGQNAAFDGIS